MFNIESSHEDLETLLEETEIESKYKLEIKDIVDDLGTAVYETAKALRGINYDMKNIDYSSVKEMYSHIDGINDLNDEAVQVVEELLNELSFSIRHDLQRLTRFDRVDED